MPVDAWQRMIDSHYPFAAGSAIGARHAGGAPAAQVSRRAADLRRLCRRAAGGGRLDGERRGRRAPGDLASVRGLRPVSVYALGDQERDADPVRDRVPARLRGSATRALRPPASPVRARRRGRGRGPGRRSVPAGRRRASPGRRAPARDPSHSPLPPARRRCRRRLRLRRRRAARGPGEAASGPDGAGRPVSHLDLRPQHQPAGRRSRDRRPRRGARAAACSPRTSSS